MTHVTERCVAMRAAPASRPAWRTTLALFVIPTLSGCAGAPSTLTPAGPAAARIASLWWILLAVCGAIYLVFCGVALYAMLHRRSAPVDDGANDRASVRWVVLGGGVLPAVIVAGLVIVTLGALRGLSAREAPRIVIEVDGRLWWWEVRYLDAQGAALAVTANEIHVPVGEPVELRLISNNVIHSFWAPQLQGKLDLVPGKTNVLRLQADRAGEYRGFCAEYCGLQHTRMGFLVIASPRAEFDTWLLREAAPAAAVPTLELARGQTAFELRCATCHTVRGTLAQGTDGPDLTHLASRRTLAAATLPNTSDNLSEWIVRAQSIKPGTLMPDVDLPPAELSDIVAYLMTLR